MRPVTIDLRREHLRPCFPWDEDLTVQELRQRLRGPDPAERQRLLAKLLREARDVDAWEFVSPEDVASAL